LQRKKMGEDNSVFALFVSLRLESVDWELCATGEDFEASWCKGLRR